MKKGRKRYQADVLHNLTQISIKNRAKVIE